MSRIRVFVGFVVLGLAVALCSVGTAGEHEGKEARIKQIQGSIRELESALEQHPNAEEAKGWKASLEKRRQELKRLRMGNATELEMAIKKTQDELAELRHAVKNSDGNEAHAKELQEAIHEGEKRLVELSARLRRQQEEEIHRAQRAATELIIVRLEHARAQNLAKLIKVFLTERGLIAGDERTNTLIIQDSPTGLEKAHRIIDALDIHQGERERELIAHVTIRPGDREPQMFLGEERTNPDMLHRHFRRLDRPQEWRVTIHVLGKIDEQIPEESIHHVREALTEAGVRDIKVQVKPPKTPEQRERKQVHVTIVPGEEGPRMFLREQPVSLEALERELRQFDVPGNWVMLIHIRGDVSEEAVHQVMELGKAVGLREVGISRAEQDR